MRVRVWVCVIFIFLLDIYWEKKKNLEIFYLNSHFAYKSSILPCDLLCTSPDNLISDKPEIELTLGHGVNGSDIRFSMKYAGVAFPILNQD